MRRTQILNQILERTNVLITTLGQNGSCFLGSPWNYFQAWEGSYLMDPIDSPPHCCKLGGTASWGACCLPPQSQPRVPRWLQALLALDRGPTFLLFPQGQSAREDEGITSAQIWWLHTFHKPTSSFCITSKCLPTLIYNMRKLSSSSFF